MKNRFLKELIYLDYPCNDTEELFSKLCAEESVKPFIKETFKDAVLNREKNFPTGLDLGGCTIAIPHTDPEHVLREAVIFIRPSGNITFRDMGLDENDLSVDAIMILLIKDVVKHPVFLEKTISAFTCGSLMDKIKSASDPGEVVELLQSIYVK